jgi:hypothetical protein
MKKHTPCGCQKFPKNPFNIGRGGDEFLPGNLGEKRATEKSWTKKLPLPSKK